MWLLFVVDVERLSGNFSISRVAERKHKRSKKSKLKNALHVSIELLSLVTIWAALIQTNQYIFVPLCRWESKRSVTSSGGNGVLLLPEPIVGLVVIVRLFN